MKNFLFDIVRQLTGWSKARSGKISLSQNGLHKMNEHHLDTETLKDVFKHGKEIKMLVRNYGAYSVGINYKYDEVKQEYVITSCWKHANTF
jgi:hypothetical protein